MIPTPKIVTGRCCRRVEAVLELILWAAGAIFGLTIDEPVIVMSNVKSADADGNLEWIALQSSGLNSTSGIAKLFGLFIDRGKMVSGAIQIALTPKDHSARGVQPLTMISSK